MSFANSVDPGTVRRRLRAPTRVPQAMETKGRRQIQFGILDRNWIGIEAHVKLDQCLSPHFPGGGGFGVLESLFGPGATACFGVRQLI